MEINGVTFKDYACASANSVAGMPEEQIAEILGMEVAVWQDTQMQWGDKMSEMSHEDMAFYGEAFTNPKQGRFANVEGAASTDDALSKVKSIKKYAKIFEHMSAAEDHGIDSVTVLEEEYGLNLVEWASASAHWSQYLLKSSEDNDIFEEYYLPHDKASRKWAKRFKKMYKEQGAGLGDDIDF